MRAMSERAKLFPNQGAQAVRLPRSCRFPEGHREVYVRRVGKRIILELADEFSPDFVATLGAWSGEIQRPKDSMA